MQRTTEGMKELVYNLMTGSINLDEFPMAESSNVADEFEDGKYCDVLYSQVYEAKKRLEKRLESGNEDDDVEIIINNLVEIGRYQCMKMYEYGEQFGA